MTNTKNNKSSFGMRLINPYDPFVGLIWEISSYDEISLRLYHMNEYNNYLDNEIMRMDIDVLYNFERKEDVLNKLRRLARGKDAGYKLYIDEDLYDIIDNFYKDKSKLWRMTN